VVSVVFAIFTVLGGVFLIILGISIVDTHFNDRKSHKWVVGILLISFGILLIAISPMLFVQL